MLMPGALAASLLNWTVQSILLIDFQRVELSRLSKLL